MQRARTVHEKIAIHPPRRRAIMPKAKVTRLELPRAKLLKFNLSGKSIPTPAPQRDEIAERLWMLRRHCSDARWAEVRPFYAEALEEIDRKRAQAAEHNGGTAS
jgi:hypothetical protein